MAMELSQLHDACRDGDTERVKQLLDGDGGARVDEKDEYGWTALEISSREGHTEVVKLLLDTMLKLLLEKGAPVDEKDKNGSSLLMKASMGGYTKVVKLLIDKGALRNEKDEHGCTALIEASHRGHTEVVRLLLDKGALLDEKIKDGSTALMLVSYIGHTEVVRLLVDKGASVYEKNEDGMTALLLASRHGRTEVVRLLLDKGALLDEKDNYGDTALMKASYNGHTEVVRLLLEKLLEKGASVDKIGDPARIAVAVKLLLDRADLFNPVVTRGDAALLALTGVDEDYLGRMAAAHTRRRLLQRTDERDVPASEVLATAQASMATAQASMATAVLDLVRLAGSAAARARTLRSSDPRSADDHQALFGQLQLAAAACVQNDESGEARGEKAVQKLFGRDDGLKALQHAVEINAKELLAQPVVQGYVTAAWRGELVSRLVDLRDDAPYLAWPLLFLLLLLQLLFVLPLMALVPALEPWLIKKLVLWGESVYFLSLPFVKFGLECAADLALALTLTLIPAAYLVTAPVAPLLLFWVASGLLWEGRQLISAGSDAPGSRSLLEIVTSVRDRLAAYWADSINRVDATALTFSFVALVAFVSAGDSGDPTATSLRVVAVFLLWLRTIRALLVSPKFGPFVMMVFRMLFGDVLYFLVLLLVLLVAFAASWTVLLEPQSSLIAGCAEDLGGVDFHTTLLRLLESALTGDDYFECARDSTNSPVAAWLITFGYVTLTAVLLLNMLIAMCAAATSHSAIPYSYSADLSICYLPHPHPSDHSRILCPGWPRPSTTSRSRRRPTTSSSSRRGRSLSRMSCRRRRR
jgi:ankyrin repeat protein